VNQTEAIKILRILRTVWPEITVDQDTATAWTWAFEGVPYALVEMAARRWMRTEKSFPRPAQLLRIIALAALGGNLNPDEAWGEVQTAILRYGLRRQPIYREGEFRQSERPQFSHQLILRAVEAIGWDTLCLAEEGDPAVRAQFVRALERLIDREITDMCNSPERINQLLGNGKVMELAGGMEYE